MSLKKKDKQARQFLSIVIVYEWGRIFEIEMDK